MKRLWILDAGHGGFVNGEYDTEKRYPGSKQVIVNERDFIYEGVMNRILRDLIAGINIVAGYKLDIAYLTEGANDIILQNRISVLRSKFRDRLRESVFNFYPLQRWRGHGL